MSGTEYLSPKCRAAIDLIRRCGSRRIDVRCSGSGQPDDCDPPLVWTVVAVTVVGFDAAAGPSIETAALRLCDQLLTGGVCVHCGRPTAFDEGTDDTINQILLPEACWTMYDPELTTFRRSCEGDR